MLVHVALLEQLGPQVGRPRVDTLNGSCRLEHEGIEFDAADGVWRVAFAFDPNRKAILLAARDKSGGSQKRFCHQLIETANERFDVHVAGIKRQKEREHRERK